MAWNPSINSACTNLLTTDLVCVSPRINEAPYSKPSATRIAQDEEYALRLNNVNFPLGNFPPGATGMASISTSILLTTPHPLPISTVYAAGSTQTGISPLCVRYSQAKNGDHCTIFAQSNNITLENLYSWNKALSPDGINCLTHLWTSYYYCVDVASVSTMPSANLHPRTTIVTVKVARELKAPSPLQTGISPSCNKYAKAPLGDTCSKLAIVAENDVLTQDFWDWNPALGYDGHDCEANYQSGYYYCVGVPLETEPQITRALLRKRGVDRLNSAVSAKVITTHPHPTPSITPDPKAVSASLAHVAASSADEAEYESRVHAVNDAGVDMLGHITGPTLPVTTDNHIPKDGP